MALAILCKRVRGFRTPPMTAFIVDHRLRPESTKEAQSVAQYLGRFGIKHKVLTVDWKGVSDPSRTPNLESAARRLRFQALGRACAAADIDTLLLAHHADDQAETVLARIHGGYLGTGLTGIQPKMPIGECHGMYKVSKSGHLRHLNWDGVSPFFVESGGVMIHRPLLDFTKSELIATCTAHCVRWHEDATNADQTLTPRNAIRQLLQRQALPAALRSDRLRELAAHKWSDLNSCEKIAAAYFERCPVEINTQTSSVSFQVHPDVETKLSRERNCQLVAALLMRKFFSLVEDQSKLALKDLFRSVSFVFPSTFADWQPGSSTVNLGNVTLAEDPSSQEKVMDKQKRYFIFPRPLTTPERFTQTLLEVTEDNHSKSNEPVWTETKLFHDRWWIKLSYIPASTPVGTTVVIRFLRRGESLKTHRWLDRYRLALLPPGKLRHTIPVIVETVKVKDLDGLVNTEEKILAFPSVGVTSPGCSRLKAKMSRASEPKVVGDSPWQYTCIYKDIDFQESGNHTRQDRTSKKGHSPRL